MLKEHRTKDDAWSSFNGKVYNLTAYLPYHPGGEKELMRVAGRDGTKLFGELECSLSARKSLPHTAVISAIPPCHLQH